MKAGNYSEFRNRDLLKSISSKFIISSHFIDFFLIHKNLNTQEVKTEIQWIWVIRHFQDKEGVIYEEWTQKQLIFIRWLELYIAFWSERFKSWIHNNSDSDNNKINNYFTLVPKYLKTGSSLLWTSIFAALFSSKNIQNGNECRLNFWLNVIISPLYLKCKEVFDLHETGS